MESIELIGLQRISKSTVFNYLPIKTGDSITDEKSAEAIRALFATGFFNDVKLYQRDKVLVVELVERASIAKIKIEGNSEIQTDDLKEGLKKVGFAEGRVFNRSLLEKVEQELQRQYFALGRYSVKITSNVLPQARNRVAIDLTIDEGEVARVRRINVIGNEAVPTSSLLDVFQSKTYEDWTLLKSGTQYSKQMLSADLEAMRSYYLDRGYINFNIESTQVSITPDKKDVYVAINITEGGKYIVDSVKLEGDLIVDETELRSLIHINPNDVFSRKEITESSSRISDRLGVEGYAKANVNAYPEVNEKDKTVKLTFFVDPGKRIYIRRVEFEGNVKTHDEVLRREMRQMEGGWFSTEKLNRSKVRLQRTGFFEEVNIETPQVPGNTDQVDVVYNVTERASGSVNASLGYGQGSGIIITASVNQNNFLGTGERVSAEINRTQVNTVYSFAATDPYYTINGVSRGYRLFSRKTNAAGATSVADYDADVYGASLTYGFPLSEYRYARFGVEFDNTYIKLASIAAPAYTDFTNTYGNNFDTIKLTGSWSYDTRDRAIFAESGTRIILSSDVVAPVTDLTFYKASYQHELFIPVVKGWTIHFDGQMAVGNGYGNVKLLPFFENYYLGGSDSLRGFRPNSLGPVDNAGRNIGGNRKVAGTMELIFPNPFAEDSKSVRFSGFVDAGNLFGANERLDYKTLRASYGVAFIWLAPIGAFTISWSQPLHTLPGDRTERIQFSIGAPF